jgi:hypothetical protein
MTDAAAPQTSSTAGIWEDFIDIFHQPSQVFDRRRDGQYGLALLLLVALVAVLYIALNNGLAPITDAELSKQAAAMAEKNPAAAEQLAGARGAMEKFAMFGAVIFIPILVFIGAVLLWLIAKFLDAKIAFAAAMMVVTYSQLPRLVETVVSALQGLFLDPSAITSRYSVQIGPARFLGEDTNEVVMAVLGGLDLFTIWVCVLVAIGLSVVARVSIRKGAIASAIIWAVSLLPGIFAGLRGT